LKLNKYTALKNEICLYYMFLVMASSRRLPLAAAASSSSNLKDYIPETSRTSVNCPS